MKNLMVLPALLRTSLYLAAASQHAFSPMDDLLAFPQYEVHFTESYTTESDAQAKLWSNEQIELDPRQGSKDALKEPPPSQVQQYMGDASDKKAKEEPKLAYETMVLDGQKFLCSIPQIKPATPSASDPTANDTLSRLEEEKELARATDRGWELLSGMKGNCVYFVSGWWSYSFCYGQGVKQFHQLPPSRGVPVYPPVEDPAVDGYELGNYPEKSVGAGSKQAEEGPDDEGAEAREVAPGELVQRGDSRYLVQRLGGGTTCDLTGKDRKVEVQFHCNPQSSDRISLIKETATCAYLMVIQTPRLCNDVAFLPPQKDQPNAITCSPILAENQVEAYEHDLAVLKEIESETSQELLDAALAEAGIKDADLETIQIVGGIVVGGHAMVPEGTKIEKSTIVGGGKETYVDTIASSDGKVASEEEMKKLGLGDPRAVEQLKKKLETIAQGQQWKLDVIDTPRGREYRGIIGDEDNSEEGRGRAGGGEGDKPAKKGKKKEDGEHEGDDQAPGSQEEYYQEEL